MLRALTPILVLLLTSANVLAEESLTPKFSAEALGQIGIDVEGLMSRAKRDASGLEQSLHSPAPADLSDLSSGLEDLQARAMNDPHVRALLGLTGDGADAKPNYEAAKVIIFASFAMPAPSLRQVMEDAERYEAQVVMRGFVDNSVFKTEAALAAVFRDVANAKGFAIDPTLFRRFSVEAVPVYVVLKDGISACDSPNCAEDEPPPHDRVSGNIEVKTALELVARTGGDAQVTAQNLLAAAPKFVPQQTPMGAAP